MDARALADTGPELGGLFSPLSPREPARAVRTRPALEPTIPGNGFAAGERPRRIADRFQEPPPGRGQTHPGAISKPRFAFESRVAGGPDQE